MVNKHMERVIVQAKTSLERREICGHKARLTPPFFIEVSVPVPSQENECLYICVLWVSSWPLSMTLITVLVSTS
jgi:hypothetical protein